MKENGNSICDKVKEDKNFLMEQDLKGIIIRTRRMERVNFIGQMVTLIQESLDTIEERVKE